MAEGSDAPLTDADHEFLRHARFSELPPRVRPEELVELQETDAKRDLPEPAGDQTAWAVRYGGGF